jgi:hypothetical protein
MSWFTSISVVDNTLALTLAKLLFEGAGNGEQVLQNYMQIPTFLKGMANRSEVCRVYEKAHKNIFRSVSSWAGHGGHFHRLYSVIFETISKVFVTLDRHEYMYTFYFCPEQWYQLTLGEFKSLYVATMREIHSAYQFYNNLNEDHVETWEDFIRLFPCTRDANSYWLYRDTVLNRKNMRNPKLSVDYTDYFAKEGPENDSAFVFCNYFIEALCDEKSLTLSTWQTRLNRVAALVPHSHNVAFAARVVSLSPLPFSTVLDKYLQSMFDHTCPTNLWDRFFRNLFQIERQKWTVSGDSYDDRQKLISDKVVLLVTQYNINVGALPCLLRVSFFDAPDLFKLLTCDVVLPFHVLEAIQVWKGEKTLEEIQLFATSHFLCSAGYQVDGVPVAHSLSLGTRYSPDPRPNVFRSEVEWATLFNEKCFANSENANALPVYRWSNLLVSDQWVLRVFSHFWQHWPNCLEATLNGFQNRPKAVLQNVHRWIVAQCCDASDDQICKDYLRRLELLENTVFRNKLSVKYASWAAFNNPSKFPAPDRPALFAEDADEPLYFVPADVFAVYGQKFSRHFFRLLQESLLDDPITDDTVTRVTRLFYVCAMSFPKAESVFEKLCKEWKGAGGVQFLPVARHRPLLAELQTHHNCWTLPAISTTQLVALVTPSAVLTPKWIVAVLARLRDSVGAVVSELSTAKLQSICGSVWTPEQRYEFQRAYYASQTQESLLNIGPWDCVSVFPAVTSTTDVAKMLFLFSGTVSSLWRAVKEFMLAKPDNAASSNLVEYAKTAATETWASLVREAPPDFFHDNDALNFLIGINQCAKACFYIQCSLERGEGLFTSGKFTVPLQAVALAAQSASRICAVCLVQDITHLLLPCGHACFCAQDARKFERGSCPICRKPVQGIKKLYFS